VVGSARQLPGYATLSSCCSKGAASPATTALKIRPTQRRPAAPSAPLHSRAIRFPQAARPAAGIPPENVGKVETLSATATPRSRLGGVSASQQAIDLFDYILQPASRNPTQAGSGNSRIIHGKPTKCRGSDALPLGAAAHSARSPERQIRCRHNGLATPCRATRAAKPCASQLPAPICSLFDLARGRVPRT
jgi:hypothetical protein